LVDAYCKAEFEEMEDRGKKAKERREGR